MRVSYNSRTIKSVKNGTVALAYYFAILILQFFSRKFFLEYLGAEILGLNTTLLNLLQFLNLAELGVGAAIGYSLYSPLASKNHEEVCEIISVQGYLYRKIGFVVLFFSIILMCFFPFFFAKSEVSLLYVNATFVVLLISALFGYFFNYQQIVLTADQKDYKLNYAIQPIKILKIILQIVAISFFLNGYIWWLAIELIAAIVTIFSIKYVLRREYSWLHTNPSIGKELRLKYSQIAVKTKQLFFHKIAGFVLLQASPLIVYAYSSLTVVAVYGNYLLIVSGVMALLNAVFNSMNAGVGNLVTECDKSRIMRVFNELFSSRFLFVTTFCFGVYMLTEPFIVLWVGKEYLLDHSVLLLVVLILYLNAMRGVVESFINAYGLFQDVWAPIIEAFLNLGLSILGGYIWGLQGILCGTLFSLLIVVFGWKPYFVFKCGFQESFGKYMLMYIKHVVIAMAVFGISCNIISLIPLNSAESFFTLGLSIVVYCLLFMLLMILALSLISCGINDFIVRVVRIVFR